MFGLFDDFWQWTSRVMKSPRGRACLEDFELGRARLSDTEIGSAMLDDGVPACE